MKRINMIGNILFLLTILSPLLSFALSSEIGESSIFGIAGIVRYSWIMWFFIPIGLLSLLIGKLLKNKCQKYKKNFIAAFICIPILLIFGSYRFLFNNITYDTNEITIIEETINIDLPNEIKIATINFKKHSVSYVKITNQNERMQFENEIKNNMLWKENLDPQIKGLLPFDIQLETTNYDYFVLYDLTTNEYNQYSPTDKTKCVFISYDSEMHRLLILNEYTIVAN